MDVADPIFSHQVQAVNAISGSFDEVIVITGSIGQFKVDSHVKVISSNWRSGERTRSAILFLRTIIPFILKGEIQIFSHMTEVQSALIAPITKLFRIRHFLWYAHKSNSFYLRWCHFWLTGIVTSTLGSCPIGGSKVFPIGQGVDPAIFPPAPVYRFDSKYKFAHFGRFDPSKEIGELISTCSILRKKSLDLEFKQIGGPSNQESEEYASAIRRRYEKESWISFFPSVSRSELSNALENTSAFIHAFRGSLDKTLIEATMLQLPVITINSEYIKIFGSWSGIPNPTLLQESEVFLSADLEELEGEVARRRNIAVETHSISNWAREVSDLLS
jgi:glycosyltransferase involved in cell wall biosynthesis